MADFRPYTDPATDGREVPNAKQCSLCRCTDLVGELFGFPVCEYHRTHGEDDPECPVCFVPPIASVIACLPLDLSPGSWDEVEEQLDPIFEGHTRRIRPALLKLLLDWGATADEIGEAEDEVEGLTLFEANDALFDWVMHWVGQLLPRGPRQLDDVQRAEQGYYDG